jgi:hypothetical protein
MDEEEEVLDNFYRELSADTEKVPANEITMVNGDFNAKLSPVESIIGVQWKTQRL